MTKLERLKKNVVDAKAAAYSYGYEAGIAAEHDDDAFDAYAKARDELNEYRKERDNE